MNDKRIIPTNEGLDLECDHCGAQNGHTPEPGLYRCNACGEYSEIVTIPTSEANFL